MKLILISILIFAFINIVNAQTAEEIITKTEYTYRHIANYIDKGVYTAISDGQTKYTWTFNYFLALDSSKNVNHWIFQLDAISTSGYSYTKSSQKEDGVFTRVYDVPQAFPDNLSNAVARLGGVGGGILDMAASLMYPDLFPEMTGNPGVLYRYDEIRRLQDTTINDQSCYVVELIRHIELTQAMIDHSNRGRDAISNLNVVKQSPTCLVPVPVQTNDERKAGTQTLIARYFIEKNDNLIIRRERFEQNSPTKYSNFLKMNPKVNVENFQEYLLKD